MDKLTDEQIKSTISYYDQIYFTHDDPVPFKDTLMVYPVTVKDYYKFYSCVDILTIEKNEDPSGIGIPMRHLDYLFHKMQGQGDEGQAYQFKAMTLLELIFNKPKGLKCSCDNDGDTFLSYDDVKVKYDEFISQHPDSNEMEQNVAILDIIKCPKCGKTRSDIIKFVYPVVKDEQVVEKPYFVIDGVDVKANEYDLLRKIVCFQNIAKYDDEEINPELRAELAEKAKLEAGDSESPSLEKMETAIVCSTSYTYQTIKDLSIRHLSMLIEMIDSKLHYQIMKQGECSGMVKFEKSPKHWLYGATQKSKLEGLQTLDELQSKINSV